MGTTQKSYARIIHQKKETDRKVVSNTAKSRRKETKKRSAFRPDFMLNRFGDPMPAFTRKNRKLKGYQKN